MRIRFPSTKIIGIGMIGITALSMTLYGLRLVYSESLHFGARSIPYFVLVDDEINGVPAPGVTGPKEFLYSAGDGNKRSYLGVEYNTTAEASRVRREIREYFRDFGYSSGENVFSTQEHEVEVGLIGRDKEKIRVRVIRFDKFTYEAKSQAAPP